MRVGAWGLGALCCALSVLSQYSLSTLSVLSQWGVGGCDTACVRRCTHTHTGAARYKHTTSTRGVHAHYTCTTHAHAHLWGSTAVTGSTVYSLSLRPDSMSTPPPTGNPGRPSPPKRPFAPPPRRGRAGQRAAAPAPTGGRQEARRPHSRCDRLRQSGRRRRRARPASK